MATFRVRKITLGLRTWAGCPCTTFKGRNPIVRSITRATHAGRPRAAVKVRAVRWAELMCIWTCAARRSRAAQV